MRALAENLRKKACAATLVALAVLGIALCAGLCGAQQAWADGNTGGTTEGSTSAVDLGVPIHEKVLEANGDGTYNLTLSVMGKSQESSEATNANVVVVLDTSGSMGRDVESYVYVKTDDRRSSDPRFGVTADGEYVKLTWKREGFLGLGGGHWEMSGEEYTGDVYKKEKSATASVKRLAAAKEAVNGLADSLLDLNTEGNPYAVQMALVTFSNKASVHKFSGVDWTSNASAFKSAVSALTADGGTNWEDALSVANGIKGDSDPTYVVFVSDGDPTYYNSAHNPGGVAGNGDSYDQTAYSKAADEAKAIVGAEKSFYAIAAFGGSGSDDLNSHMQKLVNDAYSNTNVPAGHCFNASDQAGLENAFASIVSEITKSHVYTDVVITDKMSGYADAEISKDSDGKVTGAIYKQNGVEWEDAPKATLSDDGTITWNLGADFKLVDNVTYSVTFKVKPNQAAYNAAAEAANGGMGVAGLVKSESGSYLKDGDNYFVYSNDSATLKYKQVDTVNGVEDKGSEQTAEYEKPVMPVPVAELTIEKAWSVPNWVDTSDKSVSVQVKQDGSDEVYKTVTLSASEYSDKNWKQTLTVPVGYTYSVEELDTQGNGWKVGYTNNSVNPTPTNLSGTVTVTNSYSTDPVTLAGDNLLKVKKVLNGRDWKDGDSFKFTLAAEDGAPMPAVTTVTVDDEVALNTDKMSKSASFGSIAYTEPGTYTYTITEENAGNKIDGVTYDSASQTVIVKVDDNKAGQLVVSSVDYGKNADGTSKTAAVFTNTYGAGQVTVGASELTVTKVLAGVSERGWRNGDSFTFKLEAENDKAKECMPADTTVTIGSGTAADGNVSGSASFGPITYTAAGEYQYTISEVAGDIPGITYDRHKCTVTVIVTDDLAGQLEAKVSYEGSMTFENTYKPDSVESSLTGDGGIPVTKVLEGRDLKAGEFSFVMKDAKGNVVAKGTNDGKGKVSMSAITFDAPGEYAYVLSEVKGGDENVKYDASVYYATAYVTDEGEGELSVSWYVTPEDEPNGNGVEKVTFVNSYAEPEAPVVPDEPDEGDGGDEPASSDGEQVLAKTGDSAPLAVAGAGALALAAAAACVLARRRLS